MENQKELLSTDIQNDVNHDWIPGKWKKVPHALDNLQKKIDTCSNCSCIRVWLRYKNGVNKWVTYISRHERNGQIISTSIAENCWKGKSPK